MRIVHVNTQDVAGGAAKMARLLARRQRAAGHEAVMLVARRHGPGAFVSRFDPAPDPILGPFAEETGLQYLHFQGAFGLPGREPMASADLVHLHNLHYGYFNPLALAAISRAKPCLWTLHDLHSLTGFCNHPVDCSGWLTGCADCGRARMDGPDPALDGQIGPARRRGTALTLQVKSLVYRHFRLTLACPSRWVEDQVERSILAGHPTEVISNGIETEVFVPGDRRAARRELGIPEDAPVVGAVASFGVFENPIKGGPLILAAMRRVWAEHPDAVFLNVGGSGPGPDPRVVNLPFVENPAALARVYAAMDVLAHASLAETFCLVAAEAMACAVPVAAQLLGPLPEVVRHDREGLLSPPGDAPALAANISRLLGDEPLRRTLGRNGRERALAEFGLELMAERYLALSLRVVQERRDHPEGPAPLPLAELPSLVVTAALRQAEGLPTSPSGDDWGRTGPESPPAGDDPIRDFVEREPEELRPHMLAALNKTQDIARVFELRRQGSLEESLEVLSGLIARWPRDTALWRTLGVTLGLMGRWAKAMDAFRVCLEASPPQADALLNVCDMWRAAGDPAKAREALKAFAAVDPSLRGFNLRLGLLFLDAGDHRRAARAFLRELKLHGSPEARAPLGQCLAALNKKTALAARVNGKEN